MGDRIHDPNWVAVNVNPTTYLPAPVDKIAGLTRLAVQGAKLSPAFAPDVKDYTVSLPRNAQSIEVTTEPTSTRSRQLTIDEQPIETGVPHEVKLKETLSSINIRVMSPDGSDTAQYTVTVKR